MILLLMKILIASSLQVDEMAEHVEEDEDDAAAAAGLTASVSLTASTSLAASVPPAGSTALRRVPTDGAVRVVLASDLEFGVVSSASSRDLVHFAAAGGGGGGVAATG